ncbi:MAG TPA: RidA family protein [Cyclobacteriaceae bacterium]|nr:RidA family protein [Cyclobacteriaceae bacterium]
MTPEERFAALGLKLPPSPDPLGVYKLLLVEGEYAYVSGHGTLKEDSTWIVGKVGDDLSIDEGKAAAQQVGLAILATLKKYLGSLDRVDHVVKLLGMVNCVPNFTRHPYVINGCSELFAKVWGEDKGVGVRSAVGMSSLPEGIPVEIEAVFKLK